MLFGAFPHVFYRQRHSMLYAVNALMLCSMVHKGSFNVFHMGDQLNVYNKNYNPDHAL